MGTYVRGPERDFLLGHVGGAWSCALLAQFTVRGRCLHDAQLEGNDSELKLGQSAQRLGGGACQNSSGCVEKYRRDDVLPALRCQRSNFF